MIKRVLALLPVLLIIAGTAYALTNPPPVFAKTPGVALGFPHGFVAPQESSAPSPPAGSGFTSGFSSGFN